MVFAITFVLIVGIVIFGIFSYLDGDPENVFICVICLILVSLFGFGLLGNILLVNKNEILLTNEQYYITKTPLRIIVETDDYYEVFNDINFYTNTDGFDVYLIESLNSYSNVINRKIEYRKKGKE